MAIGTFFAYSGIFTNVEDALADYEAVHVLHTEIGLIDAYDAAVVERTGGGGALLGALAGHAAAGMSRSDLKELGEGLDAGQAGLVVVAISDVEAKVEAAMKHAERIQAKQLKADQKAIENDAKG